MLGKESSARKSAQRILKMMKESKSDSLVLLGDIKSGTSKITDYEWRNVPQFFDSFIIFKILCPDLTATWLKYMQLYSSFVHGSFGFLSRAHKELIHPVFYICDGTDAYATLRASFTDR